MRETSAYEIALCDFKGKSGGTAILINPVAKSTARAARGIHDVSMIFKSASSIAQIANDRPNNGRMKFEIAGHWVSTL
jgi:hypothetical protein